MKLNQNQQLAVNHDNGPMIVLAGPGSGKTTVIVHRIKNLIDNFHVNPVEILVISFTKVSSLEMRERFLSLDNDYNKNYNGVTFGTFHSFFFRIIRSYYHYTLENLLNDFEKKLILKNIISKKSIFNNDEEELLLGIASEISLIKNELENPEYFSSDYCKETIFLEIFNEYEEYKQKNNKIDFDDMLVKCYHLLNSNKDVAVFWRDKYNYILIDEVQDINKVQYECVKILFKKKGNVFVVGDDDQSIYKFRGANPEILFQFKQEFEHCKVIVLEINYRSTDEIIKLCNNIIKENKNRFDKNIKGTKNSGKTPLLLKSEDVREEAKLVASKILKLQKKIPLKEIVIVYRINSQGRAIIDAFRDLNINYNAKDEIPNIYEHWICKDILAYFSLALNRKDNKSLCRIINKPKRYISKDLINSIMEKCGDSISGIEYLIGRSNLKPWQYEKLQKLNWDLNNLSKMSAFDASKFLLNNLEYRHYLENYAEYRNIKSNGLFEVYSEILQSTIDRGSLKDFIKYVEDFSYYLKETKGKNNNFKNDGVVLSTMHSVKGLEFEAAFVISAVEGHTKSKKNIGINDIEEERRLFYVALTRAKKYLFISIIKYLYDEPVEPIIFLKNIIKK